MTWLRGTYWRKRGPIAHWFEEGMALCGSTVAQEQHLAMGPSSECRTCARMLATQRLDVDWFERNDLPVPDRVARALSGCKRKKI